MPFSSKQILFISEIAPFPFSWYWCSRWYSFGYEIEPHARTSCHQDNEGWIGSDLKDSQSSPPSKGMAHREECVHWVPRTLIDFSAGLSRVPLAIQNSDRGSSLWLRAMWGFFLKIGMSGSYIWLAKSEFWGVGTRYVYITKLPGSFWAPAKVEAFHWEGVESEWDLIRESRHQGLSHDPSTQGAQRKEEN